MNQREGLNLKNMNESKPILAIETSGSLCSTSLFFSDDVYFLAGTNLKNSHSEKLFSQIEFLFHEAEIEKNDIKLVAVSSGPGSFTGLRIGMAAAKGIALGVKVPIVSVPTFEAFAYQMTSIMEEGAEFIIANRVNKEEVYYAKFQIKANSYIFTDQLTILPNGEFLKKATGIKTFGNTNVPLKGNNESQILSSPSALWIAQWALDFGNEKLNYDFDYLEPLYLKNFYVKVRQKK